MKLIHEPTKKQQQVSLLSLTEKQQIPFENQLINAFVIDSYFTRSSPYVRVLFVGSDLYIHLVILQFNSENNLLLQKLDYKCILENGKCIIAANKLRLEDSYLKFYFKSIVKDNFNKNNLKIDSDYQQIDSISKYLSLNEFHKQFSSRLMIDHNFPFYLNIPKVDYRSLDQLVINCELTSFKLPEIFVKINLSINILEVDKTPLNIEQMKLVSLNSKYYHYEYFKIDSHNAFVIIWNKNFRKLDKRDGIRKNSISFDIEFSLDKNNTQQFGYINWNLQVLDSQYNNSQSELNTTLSINNAAYIVKLLPIFEYKNLLNTAILNGKQITYPLKILGFTLNNNLIELNKRNYCVCKTNTSKIHVDLTCNRIYFNGTEEIDNKLDLIEIKCKNRFEYLKLDVYQPEFPVNIETSSKKLVKIHNWHYYNQNLGYCNQLYQVALVDVYAKFYKINPETNQKEYLNELNNKIDLIVSNYVNIFNENNELNELILRPNRSGEVFLYALSKYNNQMVGETSIQIEDEIKTIIDAQVNTFTDLGLKFVSFKNSIIILNALSSINNVLTQHQLSENLIISKIFYLNINLIFSDLSHMPLNKFPSDSYNIRISTNDSSYVSINQNKYDLWPYLEFQFSLNNSNHPQTEFKFLFELFSSSNCGKKLLFSKNFEIKFRISKKLRLKFEQEEELYSYINEESSKIKASNETKLNNSFKYPHFSYVQIFIYSICAFLLCALIIFAINLFILNYYKSQKRNNSDSHYNQIKSACFLNHKHNKSNEIIANGEFEFLFTDNMHSSFSTSNLSRKGGRSAPASNRHMRVTSLLLSKNYNRWSAPNSTTLLNQIDNTKRAPTFMCSLRESSSEQQPQEDLLQLDYENMANYFENLKESQA